MMNKKKMIICAGCVIVIILAAVLGGMKMRQVRQRNQSGILLAFDDYSAYTWEENFDLFDRYGVRVTFFVSIEYPLEFCNDAQERGHEIGFHTMNHVRLTEIEEEEVYRQAIEPIEKFREEGIELTSFAYPYGGHNEELDERLLQYYNTLRGAYFCEIYNKDDLRKGYVESLPIDNGQFQSQEQFEEEITEILNQVKDTKGAVVSFYSHAIGAGDWSIDVEKLEFLFQKAQELGLRFYTFRELQDG